MSKEKVHLTKVIEEAKGNVVDMIAILGDESEITIMSNPKTVDDCLNILGVVNTGMDKIYGDIIEILLGVAEEEIDIDIVDLASMVMAKNHFMELAELYRNKIGSELTDKQLSFNLGEDNEESEETAAKEPELLS